VETLGYTMLLTFKKNKFPFENLKEKLFSEEMKKKGSTTIAQMHK